MGVLVVAITEQEAQGSIVDESHNPSPISPSPATIPHPLDINQNAGQSNVLTRSDTFLPGFVTKVPKQEAQDVAIKALAPDSPPIVPGSNSHFQDAALGEVSSLSCSSDVTQNPVKDNGAFGMESAVDVFDDEFDAELEDGPDSGFPGHIDTQENDRRCEQTCDVKGGERFEVNSS